LWSGIYTVDKEAFLFSVDNKLKLKGYNREYPGGYYRGHIGPNFGIASLCVSGNEMMNAPENCFCATNSINDYYNVPTDDQGNSILTGDGQGKSDGVKKFTLAAIETWAITF
jgi:hypothetical protein